MFADANVKEMLSVNLAERIPSDISKQIDQFCTKKREIIIYSS